MSAVYVVRRRNIYIKSSRFHVWSEMHMLEQRKRKYVFLRAQDSAQ